MKVSDLVQDAEFGDIALIVKIDFNRREWYSSQSTPYRVLTSSNAKFIWLDAEYIEQECEKIG